MIEPVLTARQVAELFGFDRPGWVLEKADPRNADPLPSFRFGEPGKRGPVRFRASEVEAWLQRRHSTSRAPVPLPPARLPATIPAGFAVPEKRPSK